MLASRLRHQENASDDSTGPADFPITLHSWAVIMCCTIAHVDGETQTRESDETQGAQGFPSTASRHFKPWCAVVLSTFLMAVQMFILYAICYESTFPACSNHEACKAGEFCLVPDDSEIRNTEVPRCRPCWRQFANETSVLSDRGINFTTCSFSKGDWDVNRVLLNSSFWVRLTNEEHEHQLYEEACDAWRYCKKTDKLPGRCDHLAITMRMWDASAVICLVFLSVLLVVPLRADMDQAAREEELLMMCLKREPLPLSRRMAAAMLHLNLMFKSVGLPWQFVMAVITLVINSPPTAFNLALNLLAISFFIEADDVFAELCLPQSIRDNISFQAGRLFPKSEYPEGVPTKSLQHICHGVLCSTFLVIASTHAETMLSLAGAFFHQRNILDNGIDCYLIKEMAHTLSPIMAWSWAMLSTAAQICCLTLAQAAQVGLNMLYIQFAVLVFIAVVVNLFYLIVEGRIPETSLLCVSSGLLPVYSLLSAKYGRHSCQWSGHDLDSAVPIIGTALSESSAETHAVLVGKPSPSAWHEESQIKQQCGDIGHHDPIRGDQASEKHTL